MFLQNSLTGERELFTPIDPSWVRLYVCGPTTYDDIHLGNARTAIVFDTLARALRHEYGFANVQFMTNFTDIDDKIIDRARVENPDLPIDLAVVMLTTKVIKSIREDWTQLGMTVNEYAYVSDNIGNILEMIDRLVADNHAYVGENGDVLFDISSNPRYGQLTGQPLGDEKDFALWKRQAPEDFGFESKWGRGRPGWHIECSAMIKTYLGDVIDIHGGGIDLKFPHHENEIAQSTCGNHTDKLANVFVHSNMVTVDGVKMSKSLGNHITVKDLFARGYTGSQIRFDALRTKYNGIMDFTYARLDESVRILAKLTSETAEPTLDEQFLKLVQTDLNTPPAIMRLQSLFKQKNYGAVMGGLKFLGILI